MTIDRRMISPPYLQFFIMDPSARDVPVQGEKIRIISSGECVSVPCRYREEGETELIVGPGHQEDASGNPVFDGVVATPSRRLLFTDADGTEWMSYPVAGSQTRLRIWTDGSIFPDRVAIGVGE